MTKSVDDIINKPKTYVGLLLDESGSMISMKKYAIDTYNEQLQTLKKNSTDQEIVIYTANFSDKVRFLNEGKEATICSEMTEASYEPSGGTALNDAVGMLIDKIKTNADINDPNVSVLVFVVTDGAENASKEYSTKNIADKIKELTDTKRWTFTYLGANVDVEKMANYYNIPLGNVKAYEYSKKGFASATHSVTRGTERFFQSRMRVASAGPEVSTSFSTADFYTDLDSEEEKK